ncbi:thymidine kinase [Virgisporangium aliadipatigenens]|uniref:Thymidine kinase n=1 Tax=Virgisporangium aliadipatigenens TaxID=741659 RepID=A0A8J3YK72_9ACTN|nr:thymidine kinase [Virgisporangium aliadipatigenens]GIJ45603.1 thymidine kinase [Virgisporangium aliadipatigenens]
MTLDPEACAVSGDGRLRHGAALKFFYGPMGAGKSTLALQLDHNHGRQGRVGMLLTRFNRSGEAKISSRIGLGRDAVEVTDETDLRALVRERWADGGRVDYLVCDEVHFYTEEHVDQLADLVDHSDVDVYAFGLATDFRTALFPAARKLFEMADELVRLQVEVLCWCGRPGLLNARVVDGTVAREGAQFVVGDITEAAEEQPADVHYQVLCRRHHRTGDLGPLTTAAGQLRLV